MGISKSLKVMVPLPRTILLASLFASVLACPKGQYRNEKLHICVNCTICDPADDLVVYRPCEIHRDAVCVPVGKLFAFINSEENGKNGKTESNQQPEQHRHRHKHGEAKKEANGDGVSDVVLLDAVPSTEVAFSEAEALVWDWQAITLTLAVFACILFFLVITLYSLHQARQWRRLKENFDADVEELSARLSLMAASSNEKGEILEPSLGPIRDGNYLNNRCVYLEQLLNVKKDQQRKAGEGVGNVYIQESANQKA